MFSKKVSWSDFVSHETKKHSLTRFILLLIIIAAYFAFVSMNYGLVDGFFVTILTWSFFVFCTPIADAGFLIDFPIRILLGIRMIYSEVFIWVIAFLINVFALVFVPQIYQTTVFLKLFEHILLNPIPFWGIIVVSAIGTFMSVYFGDELIDVSLHRHREKYHKHALKYQLVLFGFMIIASILFYYYLLEVFGISILI